MTDTKHLLVNYSYPLKVVKKNENLNTDLRTKERIWYSQPRSDKDNTLEILSIKLRQPILITDLSFGLLDVPSFYEVWVTRNGVKSMLLNADLRPISGSLVGGKVGTGKKNTWRTFRFRLNPSTISLIEIKVRRNVAVGKGAVVSLGVRDFLISRTIREQSDTLYSLTAETDIMGNPTRKVVQDWDAELAHDGNAFTFWKSGPQPVKNAVVNYYSTIGDGVNPERVDRFWIDPVYTGQHLNMYYSTDPTIGTIIPKPKRVKASLTGTTIAVDKGVDLNGVGKSYSIDTPALLSQNTVPMPTLGESGWIGLEFEVATGLSGTVTVFSNPAVTDFSLKFNYSTKVFTFANNAGAHAASKVVSNAKPFTAGDRVQCVMTVGKNLTNNQVTLRLIVAVSGVVVSDTRTTSLTNDTMEKLYTGSARMLFNQKIGFLRHLVLNVGADMENQYQSFIVDANSFLNPNTNIHRQDANFVLQGDLDNSILVGSYVSGDDAYGGVGSEVYTSKVWKPVWKNWTVQRGWYYLPHPVAACHIKLELTNLTEQPYPIYETGITVPYKTFPTYLKGQIPSRPAPRVTVSASDATQSADVKTQLSPLALRMAPKTNIIFGSKVVGEIRNRYDYDYRTLVTEVIRTDALKAAAATTPFDTAKATLATMANPQPGHGTSDTMHASAVKSSAFGSVKLVPDVKNLSGVKTPTWWFLPGGLKVPASTMVKLIDEQGNDMDSAKLMDRPRFPSETVHHYETAYAVRTGVAYFAGIREFQVFRVDHSAPFDSDVYEVIDYVSESDTSFNLSLGGPDDDSGTYPSAIPLVTSETLTTELDLETAGYGPGGVLSQALLKTWNSIGTFIKVGVSAVDRGLHSDTQGSPIEPLGLDNDGAFWDDDASMWSDAVATWGSDTALVGIDFDSTLFFAGREASKVYRFAGIGAAGVQTRVFDSAFGERLRMCISLYRPLETSNVLKLQLVDVTPITGSVIREEILDVTAGRWNLIQTEFRTTSTARDMLRIKLLIEGTEEETLYVGEMFDEETSVIYNISNDDGNTWMEATEVLNEPDKFLVFPTPSNKLKVRVDMYDGRDYARSLSVKPYYLY